MAQGTVQISFGQEHGRYLIGEENDGANGPMVTVADCVSRFTEGRGLDDNLEVRLDGNVADPEATLRAGDVIVIATRQSATGGYKGA